MSHRGRKLRPMAEAFVIAAPGGARVRTRLVVDDTDRAVLEALGAHPGALASADLARRVAEGDLDAEARAVSRKDRKRELTAGSSSRWAGAITRSTEDSYGLAKRNLVAERASLRARVETITARVEVSPGEAARWFVTADGESDKAWGNETIRWHPAEHWLEIKLPAPLAELANRPFGRYRLSCPVSWPHRGDEVAAQATGGSVRYDICYDASKRRW